MSVQAIRKALLDYSRITGKADAALGELEAIEDAAKGLVCEDSESAEHEISQRGMKAYHAAMDVMQVIARDALK